MILALFFYGTDLAEGRMMCHSSWPAVSAVGHLGKGVTGNLTTKQNKKDLQRYGASVGTALLQLHRLAPGQRFIHSKANDD